MTTQMFVVRDINLATFLRYHNIKHDIIQLQPMRPKYCQFIYTEHNAELAKMTAKLFKLPDTVTFICKYLDTRALIKTECDEILLNTNI